MKFDFIGIKKRRGRLPFLFFIERTFSDVVLLVQLVGLVAWLLWEARVSLSDEVAFLIIGSYLAIIFSVFSFFLFGLYYFFASPPAFWQNLLVVNYSLTLMIFATRMVTSYEYWLAELLFFIGGAAVAKKTFAWWQRYARWGLVVAIGVPILFYLILFRWIPRSDWLVLVAPMSFSFFAGLLLCLKWLFIKYKLLQTTVATPHRQSANTTPLPQNQSDVSG